MHVNTCDCVRMCLRVSVYVGFCVRNCARVYVCVCARVSLLLHQMCSQAGAPGSAARDRMEGRIALTGAGSGRVWLQCGCHGAEGWVSGVLT